MKPSLQLKIGQNLTMTPQLQHAIKLLQLSTLDLQQEIQDALDNNPLLEVNEEQQESTPGTAEDGAQDTHHALDRGAKPENTSDETDLQLNDSQSMPDELPVDSAWDDVYPNQMPSTSGRGSDDINFDDKNGTEETLQDHLFWQLNLSRFTDKDRVIASTIIEAIDRRGYLSQSLPEILETAQAEWNNLLTTQPDLSTRTAEDDSDTIDLSELKVTLRRVQQFDPPGVAAQNAEECLLIQLNQLPEETPARAHAKQLLSEHPKLLCQRDTAQILKKTKMSKTELEEALALIKTLDPYPGDAISPNTTAYVVPDVVVEKKQGRWCVALNPGTTPNLRVNPVYAQTHATQSSQDKGFIKQHVQEAKWFIKSLQSRNETLLKVATKIVEYQIDFFERGAEHMKALVLNQIAESVDMHESTISRVTTQKFMHTPYGVFELKYFFSSHVSTVSGEDCSSTAIKAMIKKLIGKEDAKKPLSDSKIAKLLEEEGKQVARRTVAKYREALRIPPSNERKQLI